MKGAVRSLSKAGSGEHTRRLASTFRLLAAWGASQQVDARVKDTIRSVIAREGRQALLRRNADRAMFRAEARALGFDTRSNIPVPEPPAVDEATRQKIVDELLTDGVTARWRRLADMLDAAAAGLDRQPALRAGGATLVAQTDPSICRMINQELSYLSIQMVFWCAPWFYWVPEPCGLATSAYMGVWAVGWYYGC